MKIELDNLIASMRVLAEQAPAGPWEMAFSSGYNNPSVRTPDGPLFATGNAKRPIAERQAACAFVAAVNPQSILVLCEVIERLQAERDVLMAGVDKLAMIAQAVPDRYCDRCGRPLDNLQGEYIVDNGYGAVRTVCHRCYPAMLGSGFTVVAIAKG